MPVPGGRQAAGRSRRGECVPPQGAGCSSVRGHRRWVLPRGGVLDVLGWWRRGSCPHPVPPQILQEGVESSRRQLLIEAFVSAGRVDNITMVMGLHPQYLSSFWKTQYLLLRMDGPLPYHKRHYIAIMVSTGAGTAWGGGPMGSRGGFVGSQQALLGSCLEVGVCGTPRVGTALGGGPKGLKAPFRVGAGVHIKGCQHPLSPGQLGVGLGGGRAPCPVLIPREAPCG